MEEAESSSLALARKLRKMVDNFETVNSEDLSRLVEMHEQPSAEVLRRWLRTQQPEIGDRMETALEPVQFTQSQKAAILVMYLDRETSKKLLGTFER